MLKLTKYQRTVLEEAHRAERNQRHADRIKVVLALDTGFGHTDIADMLLLDDSTTRSYEAQYLAGGLDEILTDHYVGRKSNLTDEQKALLEVHLNETTYHSAKEIVAYIKKTLSVTYTPEGLVPLLHTLGFTYKKTKQIPGKADPKAQRNFITRFRRLKKKLTESSAVVYFLDGSHPQHNAMPAYGWIKKGTEKELRTNTGRSRLNLNGALNATDHSVVVRSEDTIDKHAVMRLFQDLEEKHPHIETIYCILDNARYYRAKEVRAYEKNSRIKMVFLPPYAPNLNLIERVWKFYHKETLYNRYYEKRDDFTKATFSFFDKVNNGTYTTELNSLLTENFQIVGDSS